MNRLSHLGLLAVYFLPLVQAANVPWAGQGAFRILVTLPPRSIYARALDEMPARLLGCVSGRGKAACVVSGRREREKC